MKKARLVIAFLIISFVAFYITSIYVMPSAIKTEGGIKNVTTPSYRLAANYENISWDVVCIVKSEKRGNTAIDLFLLRKGEQVRFVEVINDSGKLVLNPVSIHMVDKFKKKEKIGEFVVNNTTIEVIHTYGVSDCILNSSFPVTMKYAYSDVAALMDSSELWNLRSAGYFFARNGKIAAIDCSESAPKTWSLISYNSTQGHRDGKLVLQSVAKLTNDALSVMVQSSITSDERLEFDFHAICSELK